MRESLKLWHMAYISQSFTPHRGNAFWESQARNEEERKEGAYIYKSALSIIHISITRTCPLKTQIQNTQVGVTQMRIHLCSANAQMFRPQLLRLITIYM